MSSFDLLSMAMRNLWKRKLRTFLTVLGVIIGTASIVVMVSIGIGMNESYKEQIEQMGSLQVINVSAPYNGGGMAVSVGGGGSSGANKGQVVLDLAAINKFKEIPGVETATPVVQTWGMMLISGKYATDFQVMGIDPASMEFLGYNLGEGRFLSEEDKMTLVVGSQIPESFYNPKLSWSMRYNSEPPVVDLLNDPVKITYDYNYGTKYADKQIKPKKIEVVGILEGQGQDSYSAFMPIKDLEKLMDEQEKYQNSKYKSSSGNKKKKGQYDQAMVKVENLNDVQAIQQQIKDMGYEAYSLSDYLESMQESSKMLQMGLGAIGAISLFVAAIGIANTMIMSIYERTREIGVMKVIGASLKDIRKLFLTEAAFIGFSGGAVGVLLSILLSKIINMVGGEYGVSSIPLWLNLAALLFATMVGIAAGFFPAQRAMRLSALSAIKTE